MVMPPTVLLLYMIVSGHGVFVFTYEVEYCSFKVCKDFCGNLDGNCIESVDWFGMMVIFTVLTLLIHEHGRVFHLLISSPISFFKDLELLLYRSSTCLVRVTPRYFILYMAIVKGVASLIYFSVLLSLVRGLLIFFS